MLIQNLQHTSDVLEMEESISTFSYTDLEALTQNEIIEIPRCCIYSLSHHTKIQAKGVYFREKYKNIK